MVKHLLLACVLALGACGVGAETPPGSDAMTTGDGSLAFGATCTAASDMSTECASGVCTNSFDMLGHSVCSQKCTALGGTDPSCPMGSIGQKCNMKGYCRP
jgi:hypothetical protein